MTEGFPVCQSCGSEVCSFTFGTDDLVALCDLCSGLESAGMLRREIHDGKVRYREWRFTWTRGPLRPEIEQPWEAARA